MLLPSLNPEQEVSRGRVAPTRETRPRRGPELERDGKGRKATSGAETGRGATRRDDEGRRGSRTVALNAVPSDRQHRLLHGSSARSASRTSTVVRLRFRSTLRSVVFSLAFFPSLRRTAWPAPRGVPCPRRETPCRTVPRCGTHGEKHGADA